MANQVLWYIVTDTHRKQTHVKRCVSIIKVILRWRQPNQRSFKGPTKRLLWFYPWYDLWWALPSLEVALRMMYFLPPFLKVYLNGPPDAIERRIWPVNKILRLIQFSDIRSARMLSGNNFLPPTRAAISATLCFSLPVPENGDRLTRN